MSIRRLVDLPAPFGPRKATSSPSSDIEVEAADRLDRFLADPELPGQSLCVDHRAPPASVACSVDSDATIYCGQFLSAIRAKVSHMANTSARMLRLLSLLQTHRYWTGTASWPTGSRSAIGRSGATSTGLRDLGYPVIASRGVAGGYQLEAGGALPPLLLDDDEAVAIAVGLQPGRRRGREGDRGDVGPGPDQDDPDDAAASPSPDRCARGVHRPRRARRRTDRRRGRAHDHRPGLPGRRAAAVRLHGPRRRAGDRGSSSRTGWSRSGGAGTSSPGTSIAPTGGRSGSTA